MTNFKIYIKSLLIGVSVIGAVSLTSCKDEPDKYEVQSGTPSVDYIRCLSSEIVGNNDAADTHYTNGELVEEASPSSVIALVGSNLRSVVEVKFNDQTAILNTSYMTDNSLIVSVPKSVPTKVTDVIYLKNENGDVVEVPFHVIIPAPDIAGMDCEYTDPGEETTLTGQYFVDDPSTPLAIYFKDEEGNNVEATIKDIASDYSSVKVVIPESAVEGSITATSIYGTSTSTFHYKDTRGMLFDFDTPNSATGGVLGNHGWHARTITSDDTSLSGNYVQLGPATLDEAAGWNDGDFSFEYWPGNWEDPETYTAADGPRLTDVADFKNWQSMALKFELYVPKDNPWMAGALQIIPAPVTVVSYGNAGAVDVYGNVLGGCNNTFISGDGVDVPRAMYRPWTTTGSYDTGDKWVTVTVPLSSSFTFNASGGAATDKLSADSFASLTMFLCGGGINGTECNPILKIDNIRVVPYK